MAIIVLCPIPFGCARPWSVALLSIVAGILITISSINGLFKSPQAAILIKYIWPSVILFFIAVVWAYLQTSSYVPAEWHAFIWSEVAEILPLHASSITIDRYATMTGIMRLVMYAVFFLLFLIIGFCPKAAFGILRYLMISATIYATYGIVMVLSRLEMVLWYNKEAYIGDVTGTFINRNSFATYLALAMLVVCVQLLDRSMERRDEAVEYSLSYSISAFISRNGFLLWCLIILASALFLTHSRAGLVSGVGGIIMMICAVLYKILDSTKFRYILTASAAIFVMLFVINGSGVLERINHLDINNLSGDLRFQMYSLALSQISANPWLGTGLGAFESFFLEHQTLSVLWRIDMLHNSYLENLLELGVPAAISLLCSVIFLVVHLLLNYFKSGRDRKFETLGISATFVVALHSTVDFSLQIPAVSVVYVCILGICCGQSFRNAMSRRTAAAGPAMAKQV